MAKNEEKKSAKMGDCPPVRFGDGSTITFTAPDMVNHPPHYTQAGIECIDAIKAAVTDKDPFEAWLVGQIIKYIWRYPMKNGVEDLEKAKFYLDRLIDIFKEESR